MKHKLVFAIFMAVMLVVGPTVSHATIAPPFAAQAQTNNQSTVPTDATNKRVKKNKIKRAAIDAEKGTKATGKAIGKGGKKTGKIVAKGSEKTAEATAVATKDSGKAIAKGAEKTGEETARAARKIGSAFKPHKQTKAQP
jgi:hypothetical protein